MAAGSKNAAGPQEVTGSSPCGGRQGAVGPESSQSHVVVAVAAGERQMDKHTIRVRLDIYLVVMEGKGEGEKNRDRERERERDRLRLQAGRKTCLSRWERVWLVS